jgi:hypothetical protein
MRTLAGVLFVAGVAAVAIALARTPTVADGRALASRLLEDTRKSGIAVEAMSCDPRVPIGRAGATFTCVATLATGARQVVELRLTPDGNYELKPQPPTQGRGREPGREAAPRNGARRDPWGDRP